MKNVRRRYYATVWCTFLCMFVLWHLSSVDFEGSSSPSKRKQTAASLDTATVTLVPGELPGYTGWARLEHTLAGSFRIVSQQDTAVVGKEWNVTVECLQCHGNAHFFTRAYGPAVVPGNVRPHNNNLYTISFLPMDAGMYTVEVVLVSSGAPSWDMFPVVGEEPWYEGFLLPGFPLHLGVAPVQMPHNVQRNCHMSDLLSKTTDSAYYKARWVVVDKVSHRNHVVSTSASRQANIRGYRSGHQSLGIFMDYRYQNCVLQSYQGASRRLAYYTNNLNAVHVVFVGDSVMRLQHEIFERTFRDVMTTTYICTSGGIVQMMNNVTSQLQAFSRNYPNHRRFLLFNTGLHDISQLCSRVYREERAEYIKESDANFSCTEQYRHSFQRLVAFVQRYAAELRVFQSTTAGWSRYGNFDIEWPTNETQSLALSSNMVSHFNDIAFNVLKNTPSSIQIMDAYWLTLARPDNRQVGVVKNTKKHLVHPGEEVLQAMVRNWILILVEHLSKET